MIYMGGKNRLGSKIAAVINSLIVPGVSEYVEPFVGGAGVTPHVLGARNRFASDIDSKLIEMWRAAQRGWVPPTEVSEAEYLAARNRPALHAPEFVGFVKYACSWGGKPWGGYARGNREYARIASEGVVKKVAKMQDVFFNCLDYRSYELDDKIKIGGDRDVVYCDIPYRGTTGYGLDFEHNQFWLIAKQWAQTGAVVLVSEYTAPEDWEVVAEWPLRNKLNRGIQAAERLFRWRG